MLDFIFVTQLGSAHEPETHLAPGADPAFVQNLLQAYFCLVNKLLVAGVVSDPQFHYRYDQLFWSW